MTMRQFFLWPVLALCLFTAACSNGNDDVLQGWIEGDFIFVSPDEQGRIETLLVRQGDQVKTGQLMFTLDQDLQAADLGVARGNACQREAGLRACAAAHEERLGHAKGFRRGAGAVSGGAGQTVVGTDPADAPQGAEPGRRPDPDCLLPARRDRAARTSDRLDPAARQCEGALLRAGADAGADRHRRSNQVRLRRLSRPISPERSASSRAMPNIRRR